MMFSNRVEQESESELKVVKASDVDVDSEARYWAGSLACFPYKKPDFYLMFCCPLGNGRVCTFSKSRHEGPVTL